MAKPYIPYDGPIVTKEFAKQSGLKFFFTGVECNNGHLSQRTVRESKCHTCLEKIWESSRRKLGMEERKTNHAREEALAKGNKYYFDGSVCVHGHISVRLTLTRNCYKCSLIDSTKRAKENNYKHQKAWAAIHPEAFPAYRKKYMQTEKGKQSQRIWDSLRRAREKQSGGTFKKEDIERIKKQQRGKCALCRVSLKNGYDIDHIIPVSKGGSSWPRNLQLLCGSCNSKKWAHDPIDYARKIGKLL